MSSKAEGGVDVEEPRPSSSAHVHAGPSSTSFLRRINSPSEHSPLHYRISSSVSAARDLPYNLQRRVHFGYPPPPISDEQDLSRRPSRRQSVPVPTSDQDTPDLPRRSSAPAGSSEQSPPQSAKRINVDMDHGILHSRPTPSPITVPVLQSHVSMKRSPVELPPLPEVLSNRAEHDREGAHHTLPSASSLRRPPSESPTLNHRPVQAPKLPLLHHNSHLDPLVSRYTEAYLTQLRTVFENLWLKHVQDVGHTMSSLYHEVIRAHDQKSEGQHAEVLSVNHDLSMRYKDRQAELERVKLEKEKISQARIKEKEEFSELCRRLRSEREMAKNYSQKLKDERNGFFDDNLRLKKQVAKTQSEAEKMRKELQYLRSRLNGTAEVHIADYPSRPLLHHPWPIDQRYYMPENLSRPPPTTRDNQRHSPDLGLSEHPPIRRDSDSTDPSGPLDHRLAREAHEHRSPSPSADQPNNQRHTSGDHLLRSPIRRNSSDSSINQRHILHVHTAEHSSRSPLVRNSSLRDSPFEQHPPSRPTSRPASRPASRPTSRPVSDDDAMDLSPIEEPKPYRSPTLSTPSPHSDKSVPSDKVNAPNMPPPPSLAPERPVTNGVANGVRRNSESEATSSRSSPPHSPPPRVTSFPPLSPLASPSEPSGSRPPLPQATSQMPPLNGLNRGHHQAEIHRHRENLPALSQPPPLHLSSPLPSHTSLPSLSSNRLLRPPFSPMDRKRPPFSPFTHAPLSRSPPFPLPPIDTKNIERPNGIAASPGPGSAPHTAPIPAVIDIHDQIKSRNGRKRSRSIFEANNDREPLKPATNATMPQSSSSSSSPPETAASILTPNMTKITAPPAPIVKKPALGFQHQDLLYNDIVNDNKLVCKQCLDKKITPPISFPRLSATWPQLKEHWMTEHPADYAILEKKSPSELIELLQRHRSSMGTSAKRQKV